MSGASLGIRSGRAATLCQMGRALMDIILHVGAHRTATTSFQHTLRANAPALARHNVTFWGPQQTRTSVFPGLFRTVGIRPSRHSAARATGRLQMRSAQLAQRGTAQLLVSDENMIGTCAQNLRTGLLYPAIGERMARVAAGFDGAITRVVLTIRAPDLWWGSAAAMTVARGHPVPTPAKCRAITQSARTWRDVITDLACAVPGAEICVMPFEQMAGHAKGVLRTALGRDIGIKEQDLWLNRSAPLEDLRRILKETHRNEAALPEGQGRWHPFTQDQCAALRETYADDLHWLTAGAGGLAHLTEEHAPTRADKSLPRRTPIKGHGHEQGQLAQHR